MNNNILIRELQKITDNTNQLTGAIVYTYAKLINIESQISDILYLYNPKLNNNINQEVYNFFSSLSQNLNFSFIVELLELLIPNTDRKEKGIVYTPDIIKNYMISECIHHSKIPYIIDPSCGCGAFLVSIVEKLHKIYNISYNDCISKYVYGVDIDLETINRAKLLLAFLAIMNGEKAPQHFNIIHADMIDPVSVKSIVELKRDGFDCVIGNPPYVRARNISENEKGFFSYWISSSGGNVDLYMPFFEIGLKLLNRTGKLGLITANGFLQGINGRKLRSFLISQGHPIKIIDFRDAQMFKNVTSYTCVTFIDKSITENTILYSRITEDNNLSQHSFTQYDCNKFQNGAPWRLRKSNIDFIIDKLEHNGLPLSKWKIRNGLATLKNDLFFFTPIKEDSIYYYRIYQSECYKIEKSICIPIAKPNIIKTEKDLENNKEVAIFPYIPNNNSFSIITEDILLQKYPNTYKFLLKYKNELQLRDKGHGKYPSWYAYGRTQGMTNFGKKLLIPYISDTPIAVLSLNKELLFYCGYALFSDNEDELRIIKAFLESEAFWFYIFHTSKPYSKGYMAFAKNYITHFSIPELNENEKQYILSSPSKKDLNTFIWKKYGLNEQDIDYK